MLKPPFRVRPYSHERYKFVVRGKVLGKWSRRYFVTEPEAVAFANDQNVKAIRPPAHASERWIDTPQPRQHSIDPAINLDEVDDDYPAPLPAKLVNAKQQLLDAQWDTLSLRASSLDRDPATTISARILELETRLEAVTSERDQLRAMLISFQNDADEQVRTREVEQTDLRRKKEELRRMANDLRAEKEELKRFKESIPGKLALRFERSKQRPSPLKPS